MKAPEPWFKLEMGYGIQRMCRAGLHFRPMTDEDQAVREGAWVETLWPDRVWNASRDVPRIRNTFAGLCKHHTEFPTPNDFDRMIRDMPEELMIEHVKDPVKGMNDEQIREFRKNVAGRWEKIKSNIQTVVNQQEGK